MKLQALTKEAFAIELELDEDNNPKSPGTIENIVSPECNGLFQLIDKIAETPEMPPLASSETNNVDTSKNSITHVSVFCTCCSYEIKSK